MSCTRRGKEQQYAVDPAPLLAIRDAFLGSFAKMQTESIKALRRRVEKPTPKRS